MARCLAHRKPSINANYFKAGFFKSREGKSVKIQESQRRVLETVVRLRNV